jgi:excinuclease ABC subunit C
MVVFEDGVARKSEYRRFIVRGPASEEGGPAIDDTAAMREVLTRRFRRYLEAAEDAGDLDLSTGVVSGSDDLDGASASAPIDPETGRPRKFAYPPSLVVVDGGLPQVNAAQAVLDELGIEEVALVGLAKRLEEVWLPRTDHPVILPRTSEGLYLLQRLRDEAHRFAITFHRNVRGKQGVKSALDEIPGIGPSRKKALLRKFGSVRAIREATSQEIAATQGMTETLAAKVKAAL